MGEACTDAMAAGKILRPLSRQDLVHLDPANLLWTLRCEEGSCLYSINNSRPFTGMEVIIGVVKVRGEETDKVHGPPHYLCCVVDQSRLECEWTNVAEQG